jgi:transcriptional regulator of arginine metabolism
VKPARQQAILEIVAAQPVATQEELVAALKGRGLRVTQATVSRDIAELGLLRVPHNGHVVYALPTEGNSPLESGEARLRRLLRGAPLRVRSAPGLAVLLTNAGSAQTLCVALDACHWPEVVGTLAGDDTIFVALARAADYARLARRLAKLGATV